MFLIKIFPISTRLAAGLTETNDSFPPVKISTCEDDKKEEKGWVILKPELEPQPEPAPVPEANDPEVEKEKPKDSDERYYRVEPFWES